MLNAKSLQRLHAEVLQQLLMSRLLSIHPVIELKSEKAIAKVALKVMTAPPFEKHLLGLEVGQQLLHIVVGAFAC